MDIDGILIGIIILQAGLLLSNWINNKNSQNVEKQDHQRIKKLISKFAVYIVGMVGLLIYIVFGYYWLSHIIPGRESDIIIGISTGVVSGLAIVIYQTTFSKT
jgi:hypothetical protein